MNSETMCPLRVYALIALLAFACSSKIVSANKFYRPLLRNERQRTTFLTNKPKKYGEIYYQARTLDVEVWAILPCLREHSIEWQQPVC